MPSVVPAVVAAGQMSSRPQPSLAVTDLTLRPWLPTDAAALVTAYDDPDIQRWHVRSMTEPEAQEWIASWPGRWAAETGADWAVCADGALVGRVGLHTVDLSRGVGEVSYWVVPAARGDGVATRAVNGVVEWCFAHLGLHRLELKHSVQNEGSCSVARKVGFLLEGTLRQQGNHADGWHDMHLHARLEHDRPMTASGAPAGPSLRL